MKIRLSFVAALAAIFIFGIGASAAEFTHPGLLHTEADFARIKAAISSGQQPIYSGWEKLLESPFSSPDWSPRAVETVIRGADGDNVSLLYNDVARAYQCALRWKISGDAACGETAKNILNAWSSTLKTVTGSADRYLASGLFGYQLANASELMRDYSGFDLKAMQDMLMNVFYKPLCERFLFSNEFGRDHNDAHIQNYWANWDLCNLAATIAIGIFCDDREIYEKGVNYFMYGAGNGAIYNAVPAVFPGSLAQWQESGRDQGHSNLGVGLMACACEMAWNQGLDLYGWANNRFMYAAEYVARYNNGEDVPFAVYEWHTGQKGNLMKQTVVAEGGRGEMRPIWEMIYNHYHNRMGYSVPNIEKRAALSRPEGGAGGHATTFDQPGFGTLLYTRPAGGIVAAKPPETNVADGVYRIVSRMSGKAISAGGEDENGVIQLSPSDDDGQKWAISHVGGGQYTVTNLKTGLALTVENESWDSGAKIVQEPYQARNSQLFAFLPADGEWFRITAVHCSKAIDVQNGSRDDGAGLIQWVYTLGQNQQWKLEPAGGADIAAVQPVTDDSKVYVTINGVYLASDVAPIMENGRVLVPMRAIFEALGAEVVWNAGTSTVIGRKDSTEVVLCVGESAARIDGVPYPLDVPAKIVDGRALVPLRFVAEALNADVVWNDASKTAEIRL